MRLTWKNRTVQNFDRYAHLYDEYSDVQSLVAQRLVADLPSFENLDVLEIGCGTGFLTKHLVSRKSPGLRLHITDISPRMLRQAQCQVTSENICWSLLDAEKEQTKQKYDLIVANMVCQWFEDFQQGINNVLSMLNTGGGFYFSLPGPTSFEEWRKTIKNIGLSNGMLDFYVPKGIYKEEIIQQPCLGALSFLRTLKNLGAAGSRKNYQPFTVPQMKAVCAAFDEQNFKQITWHILYGCITKTK